MNDLDHNPQTVILSRTYTDPVVLARPLSINDGDPSLVRITDVQADRFTFFVHEAPDLDGTHDSTETVSYIVLETGDWDLSDGTLLEVGKVTTTASVGKADRQSVGDGHSQRRICRRAGCFQPGAERE